MTALKLLESRVALRVVVIWRCATFSPRSRNPSSSFGRHRVKRIGRLGVATQVSVYRRTAIRPQAVLGQLSPDLGSIVQSRHRGDLYWLTGR